MIIALEVMEVMPLLPAVMFIAYKGIEVHIVAYVMLIILSPSQVNALYAIPKTRYGEYLIQYFMLSSLYSFFTVYIMCTTV